MTKTLNTIRKSLCSVGFLCVTLGGCTEAPKDLGSSRDAIGGAPTDSAGGATFAGGSSGAGGKATETGNACTAERAQRAECYNWRGYAENYQFRSGSDRVRITKFNESGSWVIQFGEVTLPALDANRGYPQPFDSDAELLEGFDYPLHDVTDSNYTRLTFSIDPHQFWADWCAIQTPIAFASGYACVPQGNFSSDATNTICSFESDPEHPWDCTKITLCFPDYGVCACDASQCNARLDQCVVKADLRETGPNLDGSLVLKCPADMFTPPATDLPITVHLTGGLD